METFRPAELEAFIRFGEAGIAPRIVSCELATTYLGDVDADLPIGARIELWVNCEAVGMFRYPHVAVAFDSDGVISGIAASELMPEQHDACFLGLFTSGTHTNHGDSQDWQDQDTFFRAAVQLLAPTIER